MKREKSFRSRVNMHTLHACIARPLLILLVYVHSHSSKKRTELNRIILAAVVVIFVALESCRTWPFR